MEPPFVEVERPKIDDSHAVLWYVVSVVLIVLFDIMWNANGCSGAKALRLTYSCTKVRHVNFIVGSWKPIAANDTINFLVDAVLNRWVTC